MREAWNSFRDYHLLRDWDGGFAAGLETDDWESYFMETLDKYLRGDIDLCDCGTRFATWADACGLRR